MTVQEFMEYLEAYHSNLIISVLNHKGEYDEPKLTTVIKNNHVDRLLIQGDSDE